MAVKSSCYGGVLRIIEIFFLSMIMTQQDGYTEGSQRMFEEY